MHLHRVNIFKLKSGRTELLKATLMSIVSIFIELKCEYYKPLLRSLSPSPNKQDESSVMPDPAQRKMAVRNLGQV
jgi:hypothetical protein